MDERPTKAISVTEQGEPDGFQIGAGFWPERDFHGVTRLVASAPPERLAAAHAALVAVLGSPLGVLYRQVVDRRAPRPEGAPPRDLVALEVDAARVRAGLADCAGLIYQDARAELWLRGALGDQVVLDGDGLLYCYPDDPGFRDALGATGIAEGKVETLQERDYVRHQFHAAFDAQEDHLIAALGLVEVTPQRKG